MSANDKAAATWHPHDRPAPGVYEPGQTQQGDIGDGLRARVELEHYLSTACHHDQHDRCRRSCKFCAKPCRCTCHRGDQ